MSPFRVIGDMEAEQIVDNRGQGEQEGTRDQVKPEVIENLNVAVEEENKNIEEDFKTEVDTNENVNNTEKDMVPSEDNEEEDDGKRLLHTDSTESAVSSASSKMVVEGSSFEVDKTGTFLDRYKMLWKC